MAKYTYTVKKGGGSLDPIISNVQDISWSGGRNLITDQLASGRYRVTGRRPDLLPTITIGDVIAVYYTSPVSDFYRVTFAVADFIIHYGFTSSADTWEIIGEDAFASLGRTEVDVNIATTVGVSITNLSTASGVLMSSTFGGQWVFDQSLTNVNGLTVAATLWATEQPNFLRPDGDSVTWIEHGTPDYYTYTATDATATAGQWKYDVLTFGGMADNYATQVRVTSTGVGTVSSGTGKRVYEMQTYSDTTADLGNIAGTYAGYLSQNGNIPNSISFFAEAQRSDADIILPIEWSLNNAPLLNIVFRGTTYYTMVLGVSVTATPDSTRVTLNLAPSQVLTAFTLDSAIAGILGGTGIIYNTPMDYNESGYTYNDNYADNGNRLGF